MNVNCVKIGRGGFFERYMLRFDKTREIFPRVTHVLSILLTTAATSASV